MSKKQRQKHRQGCSSGCLLMEQQKVRLLLTLPVESKKYLAWQIATVCVQPNWWWNWILRLIAVEQQCVLMGLGKVIVSKVIVSKVIMSNVPTE